jgi:aspartyl-tRNA(Asn)/glutamyl-tRNA(Gln) amidotransferase subunit A
MSKWKTIVEIAEDVQAGRVTASENIEKALEIIQAEQAYDAIIATTEARARKRAKDIDKRIKGGEKVGRLAGVPFIAKDNFLTFGSETTAASNILKGFTAPYQATVIERVEAEGAICVAKANMDAFGHGGSTENSDFMITKNPHNKSRVPGGSSGGPAAAIILDMAPFALATDTGGSIRQPASFSGAVGHRPTYGLVSRSGVVAMASSTDTIGPITKTVAETALVLDIIAGKDELDGTTIDRDPAGFWPLQKKSLQTVKIGLIKEYMSDDTDKSVRDRISAVSQALQKSGATVDEISLPSLKLALAAYYIIVPAEISSNLSRYDGQHYGHNSKEASDLEGSYNWSRSEGFGNEAKRRIMIGTYVLSSGYYDAYYRKAQQLRTKIIDEFSNAFEHYEYLIGPAAPTTAFEIGSMQDPLKLYLQDLMTVAAALAGIPAITVPAGFDEQKLPIGLQVMSKQRNDRALLELAATLEGEVL